MNSYIRLQKRVTNLGGILLLIVVLTLVTIKFYLAAIISGILSLGFYLHWRRMDKGYEKKEANSNDS